MQSSFVWAFQKLRVDLALLEDSYYCPGPGSSWLSLHKNLCDLPIMKPLPFWKVCSPLLFISGNPTLP